MNWSLTVTKKEMAEGLKQVKPEFIAVLEKAAANIRKFHSRQVRNSFIINDEDGIVMGQKVIPVDRAGVYVPGGTATYPSTVLMDIIPAKIAGVKEVIVTTPPGPDGKVNPYVLAAAKVAGVDRILKVGGAQAIAALAYGTETVPKVDKIVGPGNAFVAEAKKQVFGIVSIDMIAGPSEVLCVADAKSDPRHVAADLLAQAEHDKNASAVLVTDSMELAEQVAAGTPEEQVLDELGDPWIIARNVISDYERKHADEEAAAEQARKDAQTDRDYAMSQRKGGAFTYIMVLLIAILIIMVIISAVAGTMVFLLRRLPIIFAIIVLIWLVHRIRN